MAFKRAYWHCVLVARINVCAILCAFRGVYAYITLIHSKHSFRAFFVPLNAAPKTQI